MFQFLYRLLLTVLVAAIVGFGGLAFAKRMQTGTWSLPNQDDVAWIRHVLTREDEPPRVIYLDRAPLMVKGGFDDASGNRSQLIDFGVARELPGYAGSDRQWAKIVQCVRSRFADFDVVVTDRRPVMDHGYVLVHVGGEPKDLFGVERKGMGGVAPYNGDVIADSMVFVFSETLGDETRTACETVAHEVGHIYGLDHAYRCSDVMTYLSGCGKKRFIHADVRCGENERRDCDSGEATQNSHERLLDVLGPRKRAQPETLQPQKKSRRR